MFAEDDHPGSSPSRPELIRGIGLAGATSLNMIDMIGVGPFITIPLIVSAVGGPQAIVGWVLGAVFALCDGLVWAELGAAMPGAGGSYRYLSEIYGSKSLGRLISFLFVWQLSFSAPLSIASGCIGLAAYSAYFWPRLERIYVDHPMKLWLPLLGNVGLGWRISGGTLLAVAAALMAVFLLYRRITSVGFVSKVMGVVVVATMGWVILAGLTHFSAARAFSFPAGAFYLSRQFFLGMGSAMLIATYDYWGYYNVCFIGGEVRDPGKTIPRALLLSISLVAGLYLLMNISILGVIPWQELEQAARSNTGLYTVSLFMQRIYGPWAAGLATILLVFTAFASVFSLMLGYSRVPYAAALDGNYFRIFGQLHPQHHMPHISLIALGLATVVFCFFKLADVIAALVVIRIALQFLVQAVGIIVLRLRRPDLNRPFRMWLYPLPALVACGGFLFVLFSRTNSIEQIRYALVILVTGAVIYLFRAWGKGEWPFAEPRPAAIERASGH